MTVRLHAYQYSVYCWIVSMVCHAKGIEVDWIEVNPFDPDASVGYEALHPFRRVPVLEHDDFRLYETTAICRYLDETFPGLALQPATARERARMSQIIAVTDSYAYWPLVRQVFAHRIFAPQFGEDTDENEISAGLTAAGTVLPALEGLVSEGPYLLGDAACLADFHLAAMIGYFTMAPEGMDLLSQQAKLAQWWQGMRHHDSVTATAPL